MDIDINDKELAHMIMKAEKFKINCWQAGDPEESVM